MTKAELRQRVLEVRKKMSAEEHRLLSKLIFDKVISLPEFKVGKTLFIYIAYSNEAETKSLIEYALSAGKTVCVPCVREEGEMVAVAVKNLSELKKNRYGISEPADETNVVDKDAVDVAIVPGVVFDKKLNRLGFGKGYYDNFLRNTRCAKIALAFDFQIQDAVPSDEHDVKMDVIVTPSQIIR